MERTTTRRSRDPQVGVVTAQRGAAADEVGVASRSRDSEVGVASRTRDSALYTAVGVSVGVVVVAMVMIVAFCAWKRHQQRRLLGSGILLSARVAVYTAYAGSRL